MPSTTILTESMGWLAMAVVVSSFFFANPTKLRAVQIFGSFLWMIYGIVIGSTPVIVANVLVFTVATWTTFRNARTLGLRRVELVGDLDPNSNRVFENAR